MPAVPRARRSRLAVALALLALGAGRARAESGLLLPVPHSFGAVPASTYDEDGRRVGDAHLVVERMENGLVRMLAQSGIQGAERNVVTADLEFANGGSALRLVRQTSRSFDAAGQGLGQLTVDHRAREGSCEPPPGRGEQRQTLVLPEPDTVANIPVNLLFLPLATGESDEVDFQLFLCRGKPRLVSAKATVARHVKTDDGIRDIVEIQYDVDFGPLLSRMARPFMPKLAVWFDPQRPDGWLAHRMPLFAQGPTVMVVRAGIAPDLLR